MKSKIKSAPNPTALYRTLFFFNWNLIFYQECLKRKCNTLFSLIKWLCWCMPSIIFQISFDGLSSKFKTIRFFFLLKLKNHLFSIWIFATILNFSETAFCFLLWHANANWKYFSSWWTGNDSHKSNPLFIFNIWYFNNFLKICIFILPFRKIPSV